MHTPYWTILNEWPDGALETYLAYHSLYPIDGTREDYRHAVLCETVGAAQGLKVKGEKCIPRFGVEQTASDNDTKAYFIALQNAQRERQKQQRRQ
jgi:hypothetical protein